jgi:hypothetical protein
VEQRRTLTRAHNKMHYIAATLRTETNRVWHRNETTERVRTRYNEGEWELRGVRSAVSCGEFGIGSKNRFG